MGVGGGCNNWWVDQIEDGCHWEKDESLVPVLTLPRGCTLVLVLFRSVALYCFRAPISSRAVGRFSQ